MYSKDAVWLGAFFVAALVWVGCSTSSEGEPKRSDAGADVSPDAPSEDSGSDAAEEPAPDDADSEAGEPALEELHATVSEQVETLVDPSGKNASLAVGAIVAIVSEPHTSVLGFGALHKGGTQAPDGKTCFQIGSVSKVFTGLLLASRVVQGLLPDTPVNDLLDDDVLAPSYGSTPVTVEQLASHYGAMPEELPDNVTGPPWSPAMGYSRALLAEYLAGYELPYVPGSQYLYSNTGSGLLGLALVDEGGHGDFHVLLQEITVPLGMNDTGTNDPAFVAGLGDRIAQGYFAEGGKLQEVGLADMGVLAGAGEIIATGDDLASFLRVLTGLDPEPVQGAVDRALVPLGPGAPGTQVGYGFNMRENADRTTYEKSGSASGYSANIRFRRDPQIGVAVVVNRRAMPAVATVASACLDALEELVR